MESTQKDALVALSFSGAIGLTFLMLGCALEDYGGTVLVGNERQANSLVSKMAAAVEMPAKYAGAQIKCS
ncbi:hypothetical protein H8959_005511 [Pygathrix nigripes]